MNTLLIGNAISMIGCLIMVAVGFLKKKSHILIAQSIQCCFMGFGNLILGGVSGFVANIVTIARNLVFMKHPVTTRLKVLFIAVQLLLSLGSMSLNVITWLPLLSAALFTWYLDTDNAAKLKIVILCTQVMWLIYDLYYRNYVASAFDVMTMVSNIIGFFLVRREK